MKVSKILIIFIFPLLSLTGCQGQTNLKEKELFVFLNSNDSLIVMDSSYNSLNEKVITIKLYDKNLKSKKKKLLENSFILPEGFSDFYFFEVTREEICEVESLSQKSIISREDFLTMISKQNTIPSVVKFIKVPDAQNKYLVYTAHFYGNE